MQTKITVLTILELKNAEFQFQDCFGNGLTREKKLVPVITIKDGEIIV
jgi:predicted amidohydrolase